MIAAAVVLITVAGVVLRFRDFARPVRRIMSVLLAVAAAATTILGTGFIVSGEYAGVGIMVLQSAVFIAVLCTQVSRSIAHKPSRESVDVP